MSKREECHNKLFQFNREASVWPWLIVAHCGGGEDCCGDVSQDANMVVKSMEVIRLSTLGANPPIHTYSLGLPWVNNYNQAPLMCDMNR